MQNFLLCHCLIYTKILEKAYKKILDLSNFLTAVINPILLLKFLLT